MRNLPPGTSCEESRPTGYRRACSHNTRLAPSRTGFGSCFVRRNRGVSTTASRVDLVWHASPDGVEMIGLIMACPTTDLIIYIDRPRRSRHQNRAGIRGHISLSRRAQASRLTGSTSRAAYSRHEEGRSPVHDRSARNQTLAMGLDEREHHRPRQSNSIIANRRTPCAGSLCPAPAP